MYLYYRPEQCIYVHMLFINQCKLIVSEVLLLWFRHVWALCHVSLNLNNANLGADGLAICTLYPLLTDTGTR